MSMNPFEETYNFGTASLLELRRRSQLSFKDGECALWKRLKTYRKESEEIIALGRESNKEHFNQIKGLFRRLWNTLSNLKEDNANYLPPIYEGNHELDSLLDDIIKNLFQRECGWIMDSSSNCGHCVLGGVDGSGKSTLIRALAIGIAVLFRKLTPLCWDYRANARSDGRLATPTQILHDFEFLLARNSSALENSCNLKALDQYCLDIFKKFELVPVLLLDEFHVIYKTDSSRDLMIKLAEEVCKFSRQRRGTYCIIAGSSSKMRSLVFRSSQPESVKWDDYPDFNGSLFAIKYVSALRTSDQLKSYIALRYPDWNLSDQEVLGVLHGTGGIGRYVHNFYLNSKIETLESVLNQFRPNRRGDPSKFFHEVPSFQLFIYTLLAVQPPRVDTCPGIDYHQLRFLLEEARFPYFEDEVNKWVDAGMAYILKDSQDTPHEIQIAIPKDLSILGDRLSIQSIQIIQLWDMLSMVILKSSNSGNAMEKLLRPHVFKYFNKGGISYSDDILKIDDDILYVLPESENTRAIATVGNLHGKFMAWNKETGIDGVVFLFNESMKKPDFFECSVCIWQNKGGCRFYDKDFGGGSLDTPRAHFKKTGNLSEVYDSQISGVLVKAEVGAVKLMTALLNSMSNIEKIHVDSILVTTSKAGKNAEVAVNKLNRAFYLNRDLYKTSVHKKKFSSDRTSIIFKHGLSWIENSLPKGLSNFLPPKWTAIAEEIVHEKETNRGLCVMS